MPEKRTKELKIRLTPSEYEQLQNSKTIPHLARWMRETCLKLEDQRTTRPIPKTNPKLLIALAHVTGSLNKLHLHLNSTPHLSPFKTKKSQQALLENIDQSLKTICETFLPTPSTQKEGKGRE